MRFCEGITTSAGLGPGVAGCRPDLTQPIRRGLPPRHQWSSSITPALTQCDRSTARGLRKEPLENLGFLRPPGVELDPSLWKGNAFTTEQPPSVYTDCRERVDEAGRLCRRVVALLTSRLAKTVMIGELEWYRCEPAAWVAVSTCLELQQSAMSKPEAELLEEEEAGSLDIEREKAQIFFNEKLFGGLVG
ncbi:unnamed protein product [Camellia sinensis]